MNPQKKTINHNLNGVIKKEKKKKTLPWSKILSKRDQ